MSTSPECCPACGQTIPTLLAFQTHLQAVSDDESHVAALWTLLGVDSAEPQDNEHMPAEQRAHERGWQLL
jgi:hypothetical protein